MNDGLIDRHTQGIGESAVTQEARHCAVIADEFFRYLVKLKRSHAGGDVTSHLSESLRYYDRILPEQLNFFFGFNLYHLLRIYRNINYIPERP